MLRHTVVGARYIYGRSAERSAGNALLRRETGKHEYALMRWGFVPFPFWAKKVKICYTAINARAEEVASKPAFRGALKNRRCLVPADAFYECERLVPKTKRPFALAL